MLNQDTITPLYNELKEILDSHMVVEGRSVVYNFENVMFRGIRIDKVNVKIVSGQEGYHAVVGSNVRVGFGEGEGSKHGSYRVVTINYESDYRASNLAQLTTTDLSANVGIVIAAMGDFRKRKMLYIDELATILICFDYYISNIVERLTVGYLRISNGKLVVHSKTRVPNYYYS